MTSTAAAFAQETTIQPTVLGPDVAKMVREHFETYRKQSGSSVVALVDPSGSVLARDGAVSRGFDLDALAVIATASFAANQQLAKRLGDRTFGGICHQGTAFCLYAAPLTREFILLSLYQAEKKIEDIRQSLVRIIPRINQVLVIPSPMERLTVVPGTASA